ncbi:uncharacterized protein LOC115799291 [Archocentrus centrarchus]|uniref:uncharacterized protein LOC115799291 n=1 Tax=Archocentrus centrarchus TaxID=63155 RepID=UPI0011E9F137|nr:uncharacterized protein LOC115799291 [Archocentrus centrarchus]
MNITGNPDVATAIHEYFESGHTYEVILDMLRTNHDVSFSMRTLKTHLKEAGLYRRRNYSPLPEVRHAIMTELRGPGQLFGYRTMWQVLKQKHKLRVKRDGVMRLLRQLNPQGIAMRTRRRFTRRTYHSMGPNYIWHVDGYDKLKPFGLALSGCIDGFSRRMMWLVCGATNNNPSVIALNYINCVKSLGVIPMRLRTDLGTENGTLAAIQCTLRHAHTDYYAGSSSHSYGSSTGNQRIESWWSFLRTGRSQFWMDLFGDLRDFGTFNGSHEHQCLLRFCFSSVLQTWMNAKTSGTNTGSGQADLHHVLGEFQMNSISCLTDMVQETVDLLLRRGNWMCSLKQGKRLNCVVIKTLRNTYNWLYDKMDYSSHKTGNQPQNCIYC